MESENFHHQEDHQLLVDSSCHALSWYQNSILNIGTRNNTNLIRDVKQNIYQNIDLIPMSQDSRSPSISMENFESTTHDEELQHLARIKHELSGTRSYSQLPQIISSSSSPTSSIEDFMSKNNNIQRIRYNNNNNYITNQDILFKTFSNRCQIKNDQLMNQIPSSDQESISYPNIDSNSYYRGTFSQIFPTLNVSNLNHQPSTCDINLPALDQFGSPTSNGSFSYQPSSLNAHNLEGFCKDNYLSYGVDHQMNNKTAAAFIMGSTEAKRSASNYMDVKASKATPTKKSKLDLRPSCSPLKIRKEKLGDRISALQQMVAPFGKTDTASVLMEAIGYIKFLQNQVETLSVPYMNSTQKTSRMSTRGGSIKSGDEETKRDLRSRGLCLVPVSCLTYVTYADGSIWATL